MAVPGRIGRGGSDRHRPGEAWTQAVGQEKPVERDVIRDREADEVTVNSSEGKTQGCDIEIV